MDRFSLKLFDKISKPVFVTEPETGKIIFSNRAMNNLLGRESIVGFSLTEIFDNPFSSLQRRLNEIVLKEKSITYQNIQIGNNFFDGEKVLIYDEETNKSLIFDIFVNKSLEHNADELLRETEAKYVRLFNYISVGIAIVRASDYTILEANKSFLLFTGTRLEDVIYKPIYELKCCGDKDKVLLYFQNARETGSIQSFETILNTQYPNREFCVTIVYQKEFFEEPAFLVTLYENPSVALANKEILSTLQRDEEIRTWRDKFLSMIAHEIRNPLAGILVSLEILDNKEESLTTAKRKQLIKQSKLIIKSIDALIEKITAFAKLESGIFHITKDKINLKEFLETIVESYNILNPMNPQIIFSFAGEHIVTTDSTLITLIINNLLSNALKYKEINTQVEFKTIVDDKIRISINNQGKPIPSDQLEKVFDPFYRASNIGKTHGYGIGLSIVKKAVESLNGEVNIESNEADGTTVIVTLPKD